jgi:transcriptional regulator with XRE-family HTH domain
MMCYITVVGGEAEGRYVKLDGAKVRWHRDQLGWTLDDVAEQAEVAKGTVLRAEHGEDVRPSSGRRIARAFGIEIPELSPEKPGVALAGKAEAPEEAGPRKLHAHLYDGARKGIETFCDHWERLLEAGDLSRESLEELRVGIRSFNPVVDTLVAVELRDLGQLHHKKTGAPLVYAPLALRRKFGHETVLGPVVERYNGVCLKAMRTRAKEMGADPEQDADVISLEERRKTFRSKAS